MTYQGRSPDDMPLAAYTKGVKDEHEDDVVPEPPRLSQQDAMALLMGVDAAPDAAAADTPPATKTARRRPRLPRPSLPRPGLPSLSLSRPGASRNEATTEPAMVAAPSFAAASPYAASTGALAGATVARPSLSTQAMPAGVEQQPAGSSRRWRGLGTHDLGTTLRDPRRAVRDPRILTGVVAVGVILGGVILLGGRGNPAGGPAAGASAGASSGPGVVPAAPGFATIQVSGKWEGAYSLAGSTGLGRPADAQLASTWVDATGSSLSLTGRSASGTRTTAAELVLVVTVMVDSRPVTFTSDEGDCTIGMAEKVLTVQGSFVCPEVTSDDGKLRVKITGTYQT